MEEHVLSNQKSDDVARLFSLKRMDTFIGRHDKQNRCGRVGFTLEQGQEETYFDIS